MVVFYVTKSFIHVVLQNKLDIYTGLLQTEEGNMIQSIKQVLKEYNKHYPISNQFPHMTTVTIPDDLQAKNICTLILFK